MQILYNEAERQRTLDMISMIKAFNLPKNINEIVSKTMKVHGPYTEGFYQNELQRLKNHHNPFIVKKS